MSFLERFGLEKHVQKLIYIYDYILDIVITGNGYCAITFDVILMSLYSTLLQTEHTVDSLLDAYKTEFQKRV